MKVCSFFRYPDDVPMVSPDGNRDAMNVCVEKTVAQIASEIKVFARERSAENEISDWNLMKNMPCVIIVCSDKLATALQSGKFPGLQAVEDVPPSAPPPARRKGPSPG